MKMLAIVLGVLGALLGGDEAWNRFKLMDAERVKRHQAISKPLKANESSPDVFDQAEQELSASKALFYAIVANPNLYKLDQEDQRKIVADLNSDFAGLPPLEQDKVLDVFRRKNNSVHESSSESAQRVHWWSYCFLLLWPIIGFALPYGAILAFLWVVTGFFGLTQR